MENFIFCAVTDHINWNFLRSQSTLSSTTKIFLKNMAVLLYTYIYNISLDVLRLTFFNIYNLPLLRSPNIGKIKVRVGPKTD